LDVQRSRSHRHPVRHHSYRPPVRHRRLPLYPLNVVADLNALLGTFYVHYNGFDVSLAPDPSASPAIKSQHGDTTYYFFPTADLPLFGPLRTLGVPESVIDVFEPFFRVLVELGYDRSIPLWEPTPARLFPALDPGKVASDLVGAIGEGVQNALALVGVAPQHISVPLTRVAPETKAAPLTTQEVGERLTGSTPTGTDAARLGTETVGAGEFSQVLTDVVSRTHRAMSTRTNLAADIPKPAKPTGRSEMRWPIGRNSLAIGGWPHRGGGQPPETPAAARSSTPSLSDVVRPRRELGFMHPKSTDASRIGDSPSDG
jgi:hypothetical protein